MLPGMVVFELGFKTVDKTTNLKRKLLTKVGIIRKIKICDK